jgi:hypothetical protein
MENWQGLILVFYGIIYLKFPFILGKGYWFKTSFAPIYLHTKELIKYIRGIAIVLISIGLVVLYFDNNEYILKMMNDLNNFHSR